MREIAVSICGCLILGLVSTICWADGGVVRAIEHVGSLQISVFTSPNPLVAGPVDISVLVQDKATLAPLVESQIQLAIAPRSRPHDAVTLPATAAAATNKLFRACLVELTPGWYDVTITCAAAGSRGEVRFALEVGEAPPQRATLWPWFTWPVLPLVLFGLHQLLARTNTRSAA
jgi:hypothetical protein